MVYHLDSDGKVDEIHTGNKCASGTGEFFLQQLGRMSITLDEVGNMELPEKPYTVSGRCSVFCKSDCTHALNKGIAKNRVVAGLSRMMAGKVLELLKKLAKDSVLLVGGCAGNLAMVHYLREAIADLYIPEQAFVFEALGAALWALDNETRPYLSMEEIFVEHRAGLAVLEPLANCRDLVDYKHQERGRGREGRYGHSRSGRGVHHHQGGVDAAPRQGHCRGGVPAYQRRPHRCLQECLSGVWPGSSRCR